MKQLQVFYQHNEKLTSADAEKIFNELMRVITLFLPLPIKLIFINIRTLL